MARLKSLLLILVALWLPVQTASAVAMPFCRHAAEQAALQQNADTAAVHCHEHDIAAATAADGIDCDNCEMCHLATAGYLPAAALAALPEAASVLVAQRVATLPSHIGDPPQQPPRRSN